MYPACDDYTGQLPSIRLNITNHTSSQSIRKALDFDRLGAQLCAFLAISPSSTIVVIAMASTFRKKLYLHDPTPEELAADAAREEEARKAEQKAAKKSTQPR